MLQSNLKSNCIEAGCDEAGRGCLAGPVFAAAVILPEGYTHRVLTDSKKLSEKDRYSLRDIILVDALASAVSMVDNNAVDEMNILRASIHAMHLAIAQLNLVPEHLIIDGNRFYKYQTIPHTCIIKGDSKFLSIAAASILAKTSRDDYMTALSKEFPNYNWHKNKGYPTKEHRKSIVEFGITKYHRKTFRLLDKQLEFQF